MPFRLAVRMDWQQSIDLGAEIHGNRFELFRSHATTRRTRAIRESVLGKIRGSLHRLKHETCSIRRATKRSFVVRRMLAID